MLKITLPYGKTEVEIDVPKENFKGLISPQERSGCLDPALEVENALHNPIGTNKLSKIADQTSKIAIVVDDDTRTAPSNIMVPPILKELNKIGVKKENITIIFGTGTHDFVSSESAIRLLGKNVVNNVKSLNHDYRAVDHVFFGKTSFGTNVFLNKIFAEADVRILTGDIELHYYAGYGGGRKSVLPGVSSLETIKYNHSMFFNPLSRTGVLKGNPVSEDMFEAAKLANIDLILNTVSNAKGEIVKAFAGELETPFINGTKLVDEMYKISVEDEADIVVVSPGGHPYDLNLYHINKSIQNVLNVVKKDGFIIILAECLRGYGSRNWYEIMKEYLGGKKTLDGVSDEMRTMAMQLHEESRLASNHIESTNKKKFMIGVQTAYHFIKALEKVNIRLISSLPKDETKEIYKLTKAKTPEVALKEALKELGNNSKIICVPQGSKTLLTLK